MTDAERLSLFESMPVRTAVRRQIVPAVISQMIALIYSLADTYFVGLLNSPVQTAAVTVTYSSFVMLTAISNLFGVGGASALSRALGKKNIGAARDIAAVSFWFGLVAAVLFSVLFALFARPILYLAGATDETWTAVIGYARWVIILGGPCTILSTLLANLLRAEGNAKAASFGMSLGGVLNILLDPLLILPQFADLGAAGAGLATALSNGVSAAYLLCAALSRRSVLSLAVRRLERTRLYLMRILKVGLPSALQYALTVVAIAAQAKFVSRYPTEAVAALGIVKKLDQLPLYFSIGVSSGLLPLLAYTDAAGSYDRRRAAFRHGTAISFGFAVFCLVAFELFAEPLASVFMRDTVTVTYAAAFLRRMVTAMPLMSVAYPMIIQFQAMGRVRESLVCSILRKGVLDIPLLFLMDALVPLYGLMWVQPIVDLISLSVAVVLYLRIRRKEQV